MTKTIAIRRVLAALLLIALARPVLQHRMALSFGARADGHTLPALIALLCRRLDS